MLFPVFLKLTGRTVLVVGGGQVAATKLGALLAAGASVRVVAPHVADGIERPGVAVERRPFEPPDLDGAWLVVAAATPEVNRRVAAAAETRRVFVNAVDDPANASAYLGGRRAAGRRHPGRLDRRAGPRAGGPPARGGWKRCCRKRSSSSGSRRLNASGKRGARRERRSRNAGRSCSTPCFAATAAPPVPTADEEDPRRQGAHSAPRREWRGAMGSPQTDAGSPGQGPV